MTLTRQEDLKRYFFHLAQKPADGPPGFYLIFVENRIGRALGLNGVEIGGPRIHGFQILA